MTELRVVVPALVAAAATWLASIVVTALVVSRVELDDVGTLVIVAGVVPAVSGFVAAAGVGFWWGVRYRHEQQRACVAASIGALCYLVVAAVVALLTGDLQVGASALGGAVLGTVAGGAGASVLLGRSDS